MTPEQYRAELESNAANSEAKVLALFGLSAPVGGGVLHKASLLTVEEFSQLAATVITAANVRSAMLADLFMSSRLGTQPLGIGRPLDEPERLVKAFGMIIEETDTQALGKIVMADTATPLARISRLARAEPLAIAQSVSREVLIAQEVAEYYWDTEADPCNLCAYLASKPWPSEKKAVAHPNCQCVILPVSSSQ